MPPRPAACGESGRGRETDSGISPTTASDLCVVSQGHPRRAVRGELRELPHDRWLQGHLPDRVRSCPDPISTEGAPRRREVRRLPQGLHHRDGPTSGVGNLRSVPRRRTRWDGDPPVQAGRLCRVSRRKRIFPVDHSAREPPEQPVSARGQARRREVRRLPCEGISGHGRGSPRIGEGCPPAGVRPVSVLSPGRAWRAADRRARQGRLRSLPPARGMEAEHCRSCRARETWSGARRAPRRGRLPGLSREGAARSQAPGIEDRRVRSFGIRVQGDRGRLRRVPP